MANDLAKVGEHLAASRRASGRVPAEVQVEVMEHVERAHKSGKRYQEIAKQLGLSYQTLMGWRRRRMKRQSIAPVVVAVQAESSGALVRGPRGLRVEGLTVAELAELWARLS